MPNKLINEQSLYLKQHAHNPVMWYPWGEEAFRIAKKENKPLLISIGYSACHWCHVMERECFENEVIATFMNEHFINIKVDREEHPDVDHYYMDAVTAITGSGGWPLNVFATPDREVFYGGTYFPPEPRYGRISWPELMSQMTSLWQKEKDKVDEQVKRLRQHLLQSSELRKIQPNFRHDHEEIDQAIDHLMKNADLMYGGFGGAPKFPSTFSLSFLLQYAQHKNDAFNHAVFSLKKLIESGIYDFIGGGLCRYATDVEWKIPHFEKMLYDNALLLQTLAHAFHATKDDQFKESIYDILNFLDREMKRDDGLYFSAIDADSEGEEGKFYVWHYDEWLSIAQNNYPAVESYLGITRQGNWEGVTILHKEKSLDQVALEFGLNKDQLLSQISEVKKLLNVARNKRVRPLVDQKIILSWNTLLNHAMVLCGKNLGDHSLIEKAKTHLEILMKTFCGDFPFKRIAAGNSVKIDANLEDYAYLIHSLLHLGVAKSDGLFIEKAHEIIEFLNEKFLHQDRVFYYSTSQDNEHIPVRKIDYYDGAQPSANAVMASNLAILGLLYSNENMTEQSKIMIAKMKGALIQYPSSFGNWLINLVRQINEYKTILVHTNEDQKSLVKKIGFENFIIVNNKSLKNIPTFKDKITISEGILICTQQMCMPPFSNVEEVVDYVNRR